MPSLTLADVARTTSFSADAACEVAVVSGARKTSFSELDQRANQIAHGLASFGVLHQERVAVLDVNSDRFYEICLGCARADVVLVPLNLRLSMDEIAQTLIDCRPRILFVGSMFKGTYDSIKDRLPFIEHVIVTDTELDEWRDAQPKNPATCTLLPSDICIQLYTSGTTGNAKGVMLTSDNLFLAPLGSIDTGGLSPCQAITSSDVILLCLPHAHVAGSVLGVFGLARGARVVVASEFDPLKIVRLIEHEKVTMTVMVPVMIRGLISAMEQTGYSCPSLKTVLYGAAPMPSSLLKTALRQLPNAGFGQLYGLTETSGPITYLTPEDHKHINDGKEELALSCGRPTHLVELKIIDAMGQGMPTGEIGEIICRSPQIMRGYWNREQETSEVIRDGWFHTGDVGYLDMKGYLHIYDRKRDMIITGGENVYAAEVENILYDHPAVAEVAVIGIPDQHWGEAVKAVVVISSGETLTQDELINFAKDRMANFKVPKSVDFVESLPRNPTGKILRRMVRASYWKDQGREVA